MIARCARPSTCEGPEERLRDILDAIESIEQYVAHGRKASEGDPLVQTWFVRHLQIIGEAARALPEDVRDLALAVQWSEIIGMRHILVHHYFGVDLAVIWDIVEHDLPELRREIEALLRRLEKGGSS